MILGGKVNRNPLFERSNRTKPNYEGALFTFKIRDAIIEELEPQILVQADEPIYQLKVYKDEFNPTLIVTTRTAKLMVLSFEPTTSKWKIVSVVHGISSQRRSV